MNYRIDPEFAAALIPPPFRPQLIGGYALGGICLIRLSRLRPWFLPAFMGLTSENAAHRFAVEWGDPSHPRTGVYIPRRDSSSWFNAVVGGRLFPGLHHRARFAVQESEHHWSVEFASLDGSAEVSVDAVLADRTSSWSDFRDIAEASEFFRCGATGFSPSARRGCFDGLELQTEHWSLAPLTVRHVTSSLFDDPRRFPPGAAVFDSAFLMRRIPHRWVSLPTFVAGNTTSAAHREASAQGCFGREICLTGPVGPNRLKA